FGVLLGLQLLEITLEVGKTVGDAPDIGWDTTDISLHKSVNPTSIQIGKEDRLDSAGKFTTPDLRQLFQSLVKLVVQGVHFHVRFVLRWASAWAGLGGIIPIETTNWSSA